MKNRFDRLPSGTHRTKIVFLDGQRSRIDEAIAPLIEDLFVIGAQTYSSCHAGCGNWCDRRDKHKWKKVERLVKVEGKNKWVQKYVKRYVGSDRCQRSVWLVFKTASNAARFFQVVYRRDDPEPLRDMMMGVLWNNDELKWTWKHFLDDKSVGYEHSSTNDPPKEVFYGPPSFDFHTVCIFPHEHLDMVMKRVHEQAHEERSE